MQYCTENETHLPSDLFPVSPKQVTIVTFLRQTLLFDTLTFPWTLPPNVDLAWYTIIVMSPAHGKLSSIEALASSTVKPLKHTNKPIY